MAMKTFEAIIIGAGINGCGIALELARRNKRVLILDKSRIGSGTSSKSSRLIHGGLRYLETLKFSLVRESLLDREALIKQYPDLVKFRSFYFPIYDTSPRSPLIIWMGLKLYDFLSGKYTDHPSKIVSRKQFKKIAPSLKQKGLRAVFQYYDAKTHDQDLTLRVAQEAESLGALFVEDIAICKIEQVHNEWHISTHKDIYTSPILINASGPWIDEVNEKYKLPSNYHIRKISGIHIVLKGLLTEDIMFMQTKEKRIFFIIPEAENDHTIIGTTEREENSLCDEVTVLEEDILYLLENLNAYLNSSYQLTRSDVIDQWIGIRPLIAHTKNPTDLSREYALDLHIKNNALLLHVLGGKLTTFISLSKKAADLVLN